MSRERDQPVEVKEKQGEKSPPRDRDRSPPPRLRSRSRSGSRGRRSPPRGRSPPPRGRSRSPPRRRSSRSRSPPRRRRDSRSPPRRGRSRSRSPPRRRSRSPPRRDYGRPNRDRYDSRGVGGNQSYTGDWRRTNRERPQAKPSNVLGVFGLAPETDKESLEIIFKKFGKLQQIVLVKDRETGLSKGFCFVYYEDQQDAEDAKAELDGTSVEGRKIRVDFSLTTKPHEPTPGQYMGNKRWDRTRATGGFDDGWKSTRDRPRSRSRSRSR